MNTDTRTTVKEKLAGFFTLTAYDGSYHDATGFRTAASDEASASKTQPSGRCSYRTRTGPSYTTLASASSAPTPRSEPSGGVRLPPPSSWATP